MAQNRLTKLTKAIEAFEAAQAFDSKFGACDTEPSTVFQSIIARTAMGKRVSTTLSAKQWHLYQQPGAPDAAKALNVALNAVVQVIVETPGERMGPLREYLEDYCWRVTWG